MAHETTGGGAGRLRWRGAQHADAGQGETGEQLDREVNCQQNTNADGNVDKKKLRPDYGGES